MKLTRCRGFGGCLLRESCERYQPFKSPEKGEPFIIERYSPSHGCPDHILKEVELAIVEVVKR